MGPLITTAGAYLDISAEDYHGAANLLPGPSISSSGLKTILKRSPRHYWFDSPLNPDRPAREDKAHLSIGRAVHDVLLLAERWPEHYHVLPEGFKSTATKAQSEWHEERDAALDAGKTILKHDDAAMVQTMAGAVRGNEFASAALSAGDPEVTLAWQDSDTGVWLRARPDFLPDARFAIPDLKTAADGSAKAFSRAIANFGYHQSAALYLDGIKAIYGEYPKHWVNIVVEKEPPHVVALYELPGEDIERGRELNRFAINAFAKCLEADKWPGYSDDVSPCGLPSWERKLIDDASTPEGLAWAEAV